MACLQYRLVYFSFNRCNRGIRARQQIMSDAVVFGAQLLRRARRPAANCWGLRRASLGEGPPRVAVRICGTDGLRCDGFFARPIRDYEARQAEGAAPEALTWNLAKVWPSAGMLSSETGAIPARMAWAGIRSCATWRR